MALSLRQAARTAGVSKSTISRAIQAGRLSASRSDDGGWSIDPAELCRVYPLTSSPVSTERPIDRPADGFAGQDATPAGTPGPVRDSLFETQLDALRQLLEAERRRADELRADRDAWREQAQRLILPTPFPPQLRGWWPFRRAS
jgi:hypothetical protein